jgi:arginase
MTRQVTVLDAPSNLGLMPPAPGKEPGVRFLPTALRERDLVRRIHANDAGNVPAPSYDPAVDRRSGIRNAVAIASFTEDLAGRVTALLHSGEFPLVLGGDCSILLGPMLALRRMGRFGLCFIDGHLDLLTPETSHSKGAAGMDLALALGYGPPMLTDLGGLAPLVRGDDVVALAYRGQVSGYGALATKEDRPDLLWLPLEEVRSQGINWAAQAALSRLCLSASRGFWIHLDVDVLDDEVMPAVDSRQPEGMSYEELLEVLGALIKSDCAVGMDVTILDPELDPDGSIIDRFVTFLAEAFGSA